MTISDVVMKNVGGAKGLTPTEVGSFIIGDIIAKSLKVALKNEMTERSEEATKGLIGRLKDKLHQ